MINVEYLEKLSAAKPPKGLVDAFNAAKKGGKGYSSNMGGNNTTRGRSEANIPPSKSSKPIPDIMKKDLMEEYYKNRFKKYNTNDTTLVMRAFNNRNPLNNRK